MADAAGTSEDASVTFNVKASSGPKVTVTLPLSTTVADLKAKLAEPDMANVPAASQRLIYSGKVLKDHETLATHNVKEGNTMHLVRSAASNQRQNPASQSMPSAAGQTAPSPAANIPQNFASGTGNDPLAGLTGARYAGFAGLPSLQELANPPSPEDMVRRLQDPNFAQMMNEALSNPQMIDMMINQNPQLRAMGPQARQILQSDSFRRMLTNPEYLRGIMEMQRMAGDSPFGGGASAFPMPGATATTEAQHQTQDQTQQGQQQGQQQNPLANMFGGGGGINPFMFMQPPPAGTERSADSTNPTADQANPFAALFNPAMFQPPTQTGTNTDSSSTPAADSNNPAQQQNPFGANPFLQNMYNNPMMQQMTQQMMQNPEMMRNAMQMMFGGEGAGAGAGGMGNLGGLGGFGGFGAPAPPDNRPPEERFSTQLGQLNEMGFYNFDQNVQALTRSGGDVNGALEWLFSQPPS